MVLKHLLSGQKTIVLVLNGPRQKARRFSFGTRQRNFNRHHYPHFRSCRASRPVDHAVSAFLDDVHQRGLSEKILLVITGEFGRTPRIKKNGGRDHWPRLSTLALAGGGLRMGQVVGRSSAKAEEPRGGAVTPGNLLATLMHVLFDLPALGTQAGVPRDIASLLARNRPIRQLI